MLAGLAITTSGWAKRFQNAGLKLKLEDRSSSEAHMRTNHDFKSMARDLLQNGMNAAQVERYESAFAAAKVAAVAVVCASYGVDMEAMLEALMDSRNLNAEVQRLVTRMETSPAFVGYIHSDFTF
jgi:hypothetical protein